jgi:hypothetical protein
MRTAILLLAAAALVACEREPAPTPAQPAPGAAPATRTPTAPSGPTVDAATGRVALDGISFEPAGAWNATTPSSDMRAAEYVIPGDDGDASLAVFYFGPTGAGGVDANITRWCGQFAQADGSDSREHAEIDLETVNDMTVHTIWLTGRYVAAMSPGAPVSNNEEGWALLGAIVETPSGPYYFKAVGPEATLDANRDAFDAMIASFQAP